MHPFARALGVRTGDGHRERRAPETLGARVGRRPLPVGLVVVSRYRAKSRWRPRALSAGDGALALLANALAVRHAPARVRSRPSSRRRQSFSGCAARRGRRPAPCPEHLGDRAST